MSQAVVLKVWSLWAYLQTFPVVHEIKTFFMIIPRCYLPFPLSSFMSTHIQSSFRRPHDVWYIERLDGEADMRFFLPFINLDIRQIYKHVKQHFFTQHFFLENTVIFK